MTVRELIKALEGLCEKAQDYNVWCDVHFCIIEAMPPTVVEEPDHSEHICNDGYVLLT